MLNGETVRLTRGEYRMLALLVENAGNVIPREILLSRIWGYAPGMRTRTVDVHVRRLRKKFGIYSQYIETTLLVPTRDFKSRNESRNDVMLFFRLTRNS